MKTFRRYIEESLDNPYSYKWKTERPRVQVAVFTSQKSKIDVVFTLDPRRESDGWELLFDRDGYVHATGTGDQYRIFATVIKIAVEFAEKNNPIGIYFSANKKESSNLSDTEDELSSREKLYGRISKILAKRIGGYDIKIQDIGNERYYYLTRPRK